MKAIRPWLKLSIVVIVLCGYLGHLLLINFVRGKSTERGFRYRRNFCRRAVSLLGIDYIHKGAPINGPCLYVSNHRSMLDPLIQLGYIDAYILSKAEVGNYPILGRGARETGIILVHRHDHNSRRAALDAIEEKLRSGLPVLIYPEGTTNGQDLTADFRKGAIEMAYQKGFPVVPVMIEYPDSSYYWTDDSLLAYFKRLFGMPGIHHVKGTIGPPVKSKSPDMLVADTRAFIDGMILEARSGDSA
jgi:1-acyl-sn-glycerol-3-phosphate acyltransferase